MRDDSGPPGIAFLDHTADVGLAVTAPTLPELFNRTALGMTWLIHGRDRGTDLGDGYGPGGQGASLPELETDESPSGPGEASERGMALAADDLPTLLRAWLRELLHWHELEGLSFRAARFLALSETRLEARIAVVPDTEEPIREIKGVTLHGLLARPANHGWESRVIFDV